MTHLQSPPPTDPLQKARELRVMEKQWLDSGFHPQGDDRLAQKQRTKEYYDWYIENLHHAFPSIHAELEKVTAERDELLKGYRGMREGLEFVESKLNDNRNKCRLHLNTAKHCTRCVFQETIARKRCEALLTSFPEIK